MPSIASLDDRLLVARCRRADAEAWNELVERFSRYVYAIAVRGFRLGREDAEDVFQDVFAKVYEQLPRLKSDDSFRPWLAQLTRSTCVDRMRARRDVPVDEIDVDVDVDDAIAELDRALDVREALSRLPEACREILDRFFARDESYRTIAAALELPPGTIASRISRCLEKLRLEMEDPALLARQVDR